MRAVITVAMLSAPFDDAPASELARILRDLANQIEAYGPDTVVLRDRNGKHVGLFCIEADWRPS